MEIKKVVFVLPSIKTGGGNRVIIELSNQLIAKGIDVDVLYPYNSKDVNTFTVNEKVNFISIGQFKDSKLNKIKNLFTVFRYINKNYRNENIIFTDPIMSIFLPIVKNNNIFRFIQADDYRIFDDLLILKNKLFLNLYKFLTKISYNYNIEYLFNSKYSYDQFRTIVNRKDIEYKLIHPALNHNVFYNQNIRSDNEINICIVARKHPWKGFIDFIKVLNEMDTKQINDVFVISHDDLSDFDLSEVTLIKPKSDDEIAFYMNKSHIFISTSWWEGFGLPPIEAMACGCSVILTNAGGVNEYAIPYENCLMYEPKDRKQLYKHIETLISDDELRHKLSINAVKTSKEFSWEKSVKQLLECINE